MKLEEIKTILEDSSLTLNQKAANLEAAILKATTPSALKVQPIKERKARGPNKPKVPPLMQGAEPGPSVALMNGQDHADH